MGFQDAVDNTGPVAGIHFKIDVHPDVDHVSQPGFAFELHAQLRRHDRTATICADCIAGADTIFLVRRQIDNGGQHAIGRLFNPHQLVRKTDIGAAVVGRLEQHRLHHMLRSIQRNRRTGLGVIADTVRPAAIAHVSRHFASRERFGHDIVAQERQLV